MVRIVCWNINRSSDAFTELRKMDADVALLQEVGKGAARRMVDDTLAPLDDVTEREP